MTTKDDLIALRDSADLIALRGSAVAVFIQMGALHQLPRALLADVLARLITEDRLKIEDLVGKVGCLLAEDVQVTIPTISGGTIQLSPCHAAEKLLFDLYVFVVSFTGLAEQPDKETIVSALLEKAKDRELSLPLGDFSEHATAAEQQVNEALRKIKTAVAKKRTSGKNGGRRVSAEKHKERKEVEGLWDNFGENYKNLGYSSATFANAARWLIKENECPEVLTRGLPDPSDPDAVGEKINECLRRLRGTPNPV